MLISFLVEIEGSPDDGEDGLECPPGDCQSKPSTKFRRVNQPVGAISTVPSLSTPPIGLNTTSSTTLPLSFAFNANADPTALLRFTSLSCPTPVPSAFSRLPPGLAGRRGARAVKDGEAK
jgi:hypothetical protein